jgi:hypothetical protein
MRIEQDSPVEEVLDKHPTLARVFVRFNVPCLVCGEPFWGTVRELAQKYNVELEDLLMALNGALEV